MAGGSFYSRFGSPLVIDISEVEETIRKARRSLSANTVNRMLVRTFNDTARAAKTIAAQEGVREYAVTQRWIKAGFGGFTVKPGPPVECVVPIKGKKGVMGKKGGVFAASPLQATRKHGRGVSVRIVKKSGRGHLFHANPVQGGNAVFIAKNVVFTRKPDRHLARVTGLSVAQLPLNRAEDRMREQLNIKIMTRLEHHFMRAMDGKL